MFVCICRSHSCRLGILPPLLTPQRQHAQVGAVRHYVTVGVEGVGDRTPDHSRSVRPGRLRGSCLRRVSAGHCEQPWSTSVKERRRTVAKLGGCAASTAACCPLAQAGSHGRRPYQNKALRPHPTGRLCAGACRWGVSLFATACSCGRSSWQQRKPQILRDTEKHERSHPASKALQVGDNQKRTPVTSGRRGSRAVVRCMRLHCWMTQLA